MWEVAFLYASILHRVTALESIFSRRTACDIVPFRGYWQVGGCGQDLGAEKTRSQKNTWKWRRIPPACPEPVEGSTASSWRSSRALCWAFLVMEIHILPSCIVPCLPKLCSTTASSPAGWKGILEGLHESYSMILECKSIIQTNKHRSTYFVCWGNPSQTERFRGESICCKYEKCPPLWGRHFIKEAARVTNVFVFNLKVRLNNSSNH